MNPESKDWRDALCAKLANLADEMQLPYGDRNTVLRELYKLAEAEKTAPVESRLGALRCVEKFKERGLTQIFTKVQKLRKVVTPAYITQQVTAAPNAAPTVVTQEKPATRANSVSSSVNPDMFTYTDKPLGYVYALKLDADYPIEGVLSIVSAFLIQSFPQPARVEAIKCVKAGLRYDLQVCQNTSSFAVLQVLRRIPWIKEVLSKPPVLFGEVFIALD